MVKLDGIVIGFTITSNLAKLIRLKHPVKAMFFEQTANLFDSMHCIYDFMIDSLITVIYFCDVIPSSDWDTHSPKI